jgi:hypothetical protein
MTRNNLGGADNQQERPEDAAWICGFVDGEGCFSVSIIQNSTTSSGWQVFPEFVVTQGIKSRSSLEFIKEFFRCGRIYENRRHDNHRESLLRYCVRSQQELRERIIPFFQKNMLRTQKRHDFEKFVLILSLMEGGQHKKIEDVRKIAEIIQTMNRKVPARILESSETTRHTRLMNDERGKI